MNSSTATNKSYQWSPQPAAASFIQQQIEEAVQASGWLIEFRQRLLNETGTRLRDWLDHIAIKDTKTLPGLGFLQHDPAWTNPNAILPAVIQHQEDQPSLAIKVASVDDFVQAHPFKSSEIEGATNSPYRVARNVLPDGTLLLAIERHGHRGFGPCATTSEEIAKSRQILETFRRRERDFKDKDGYAETARTIQEAKSELAHDWVTDLFFQAEREFWQRRNHAAQIQFQRQQQLGLGWANHDHHTYRCSRENFAGLINNLELLGFECRERFYAGGDAGWGAQVLEQRATGIVIFADVDMSEDEISGDFSHDGLPSRNQLGTVGLWCKLHGDSFLQAGMHHLECQFDFDAARQQLAELGVSTMAPFTDLPQLKQAFTRGETWPIDEGHLHGLAAAGVISELDAKRFAAEGVIGSHLEILERNDGYKGFNQKGISKIIHETDPRR